MIGNNQIDLYISFIMNYKRGEERINKIYICYNIVF